MSIEQRMADIARAMIDLHFADAGYGTMSDADRLAAKVAERLVTELGLTREQRIIRETIITDADDGKLLTLPPPDITESRYVTAWERAE